VVKALGGALDKGVNWNLLPSFSHRYGAVAAGLGTLGWSGNVLHPKWGARVLYNTVITDAVLEPDPMLEEQSCDGCRICTRVCQGRFIHAKQRDAVTIGARRFEHNKKAHNLRCILVCAGFSGQSEIPGWSTWSPGRLKLPARDEELEPYWSALLKDNLWRGNHVSKVLSDLVFHTEYGFVDKPHDRFETTCGNCQLVCWRDRAERKENYKLLKRGGVVR
jgi:epoxyqueuosine reductase